MLTSQLTATVEYYWRTLWKRFIYGSFSLGRHGAACRQYRVYFPWVFCSAGSDYTEALSLLECVIVIVLLFFAFLPFFFAFFCLCAFLSFCC